MMIKLDFWRPLTTLASPGGARARLSILIYHRVLSVADPMRPGEITAPQFDGQMALLARHFNVLGLEEAASRLRHHTLPARAICITFDDGYADNCEVALPILRRYGLTATFFIATGYLNGGRMWNDTVIEALRVMPAGNLDLSREGLGMYVLGDWPSRAAAAVAVIKSIRHLSWEQRQARVRALAEIAGQSLPQNLMMTTAQLRRLSAEGMTIGAHTVNHPILTRLPVEVAEWEIEEGRKFLEDSLGIKINLFAYPNGKPDQDYGSEHVEMIRRMGFTAAVSTAWGVSTRHTDLWQLRRFTPWDTRPERFMLSLLRNCFKRG